MATWLSCLALRRRRAGLHPLARRLCWLEARRRSHDARYVGSAFARRSWRDICARVRLVLSGGRSIGSSGSLLIVIVSVALGCRRRRRRCRRSVLRDARRRTALCQARNAIHRGHILVHRARALDSLHQTAIGRQNHVGGNRLHAILSRNRLVVVVVELHTDELRNQLFAKTGL